MGLLDRLKGAASKGAAPAPTSGPARTIRLVKDASGAPAVDLNKVPGGVNINLAKSAQAAGFSLQKRGLAGIRAQALMLIDHSWSMEDEYQDGSVQKLVERALGTALQFDVDGEIPVYAWDSRVHAPVNVTLSNYQGIVDREVWRKRDMGSTALADVLQVVKQAAQVTDLPLYVCIVTDGNPDNKGLATQAVCDLSRYPAFLKFLAIKPVPYLSELDDLPNTVRLVDNVDTKPGMENRRLNLLTCSDADFQEAMIDEWDSWFTAATAAGILTS